MCLELYYIAVCFSKSHGMVMVDIVAALLLIFQTFFIFFTVSLEGAYVNEEAMKGFQLLRTRGWKPSDGVDKKYLVRLD